MGCGGPSDRERVRAEIKIHFAIRQWMTKLQHPRAFYISYSISTAAHVCDLF